MDTQLLMEIAGEVGTPTYVYDLSVVEQRLERLDRAFEGRFGVSYAVKANPLREILEFLEPRIPSLDVSSSGETDRALAAGWPGSRLSFTGPAKGLYDLEHSVESGMGRMVLESMREAELLSRVATEAGVTQEVLVRISPRRIPRGFGVKMAGRPSQFGIDEEDLPQALPRICALPGLQLAGFHVYSGTQCVDAAAVAENIEIMIGLFVESAHTVDISPRLLVFGSGFGIQYYDDTTPLDVERVAEAVNPRIDSLRSDPRFAQTALHLELGRWLVGEAGVYLTSVVSRKESRGASIGVCDGGMNHHLGACGHLGTVIHRNYRMVRLPLDEVESVTAAGEGSTFDLYGPLCTSIDTLGHAVTFPDLREGDVIAVGCSGAYGKSASPAGFISHPPAREVVVRRANGRSVFELVRDKVAS